MTVRVVEPATGRLVTVTARRRTLPVALGLSLRPPPSADGAGDRSGSDGASDKERRKPTFDVRPRGSAPLRTPVAFGDRYDEKCPDCGRALYAMLDLDLTHPALRPVQALLGDGFRRLRVPACSKCNYKRCQGGNFRFDGDGNATLLSWKEPARRHCVEQGVPIPPELQPPAAGGDAGGADDDERKLSRWGMADDNMPPFFDALELGDAWQHPAAGPTRSYIGGVGGENGWPTCPDPDCPSHAHDVKMPVTMMLTAPPPASPGDGAGTGDGGDGNGGPRAQRAPGEWHIAQGSMTLLATLWGDDLFPTDEMTLYIFVCTTCKRHGMVEYSRFGC